MSSLKVAGPSKRPMFLDFRSSPKFVIATVCISLFTDFLIDGISIPIMPCAIVARAGVSFENRGYWVSILLTADAGTAAILSPIFGYLVDISRDKRNPYLIALLLLATSLTAFCTASSLPIFIISRLLQGAATALIHVSGLALVSDAVPLANLSGALGYWSSSTLLGSMIGPLVGGFLYGVTGYYYIIFGLGFALLTIAFILRVLVLENDLLNQCPVPEKNGPLSPRKDFILSEKSLELVAKPPKARRFAMFMLLRKVRILIAMWATIIRSVLTASFDATLPLFVMDQFGWGPEGAALVFIPYSIAAFFEPFFGYLGDRLGAKAVTFTSFIILGPTVICFRFIEGNSLTDKILLFSLLAATGILIDASEPVLFSETQKVLEDAEDEELGVFKEKGAAVAQAFSLLISAYFTGLSIGPVYGGMVYYYFGWKTMTLTLGLFSFVSAIPLLWLSGRPRPLQQGK